MRRAAKVDGNHGLIMDALRKAGIAVRSTAALGDGFPDAVASLRRYTCLLEFKGPGGSLTAGQVKFLAGWPGDVFVVSTPDEAVYQVVEGAREVFGSRT